jgi:hypothetical protein
MGSGNATLTSQFEDGSTTPALESPKYFNVVVQHSVEVDPIGVLRNEASAIEFGGVSGSKVCKCNTSLTVQFEDGSTTPELESPKYFTGVIHHHEEVVLISIFRSEATGIESNTLLSRKVSTNSGV